MVSLQLPFSDLDPKNFWEGGKKGGWVNNYPNFHILQILGKNLYFLLETRLPVAYPCFIPVHIGYTACTIREQFGYRYARTACNERSELYGDFGTYWT